MSIHDNSPFTHMPGAAPLSMPTQNLDTPFRDPSAPRPQRPRNALLWRLLTFIPALGTSFILMAIFMDWFRKDGFVASEITMLALVGFTSFWIALSVAAATIGLFSRDKIRTVEEADHTNALSVALLVPVYNEDTRAVFHRIEAMLAELSKQHSHHRFAFFVLSDTSDERIASLEIGTVDQLARKPDFSVPVFYRRRAKNTERKTGNLRDWVENWGGAWDAFITLDADSLMSAGSICTLADDLAVRDNTALIQTVPRLMGASTLFARVQQFANNVYGGVLAKGLELWSGTESNYWGHNAIIRTKAFAACAGLPRLSGSGALGGTIKSHDFVEAALLRRAGWAVRMMPDLRDTYEEVPQTIIDYVQRDRRWCQGNLQHLRLLRTKGLNTISRFHMLQGAMAYIASVAWFLLLIVWALMGRSESENVFIYFTDTNPLFPQWPQMDLVSRTVVLFFMLGLLLLPKLFAIASTVLTKDAVNELGGPVKFAASSVCEILLSFLLAPILMVQHVTAVLRTFAGLDTGWAPQNRSGSSRNIKTLLRFHWLETATGIALITGLTLGVVSLWLLPIAVSLSLAAPLSLVLSMPLQKLTSGGWLLGTRELFAPPKVILQAGGDRYRMQKPGSQIEAPAVKSV